MIRANRKGGWSWLVLVIVGHFVLLLAAAPLPADEPAATGTPGVAEEQAVSKPEDSGGMEGIACYYKKHYRGKRTHSGSVYDHDKLTAAHPTLPHGARVKVVNLANNRSVIVTINDRCRRRSGEFIDLSRTAARRLGFLGKGTARVRIIPLEEGGSTSGK